MRNPKSILTLSLSLSLSLLLHPSVQTNSFYSSWKVLSAARSSRIHPLSMTYSSLGSVCDCYCSNSLSSIQIHCEYFFDLRPQTSLSPPNPTFNIQQKSKVHTHKHTTDLTIPPLQLTLINLESRIMENLSSLLMLISLSLPLEISASQLANVVSRNN
jgi:hypothetical protein